MDDLKAESNAKFTETNEEIGSYDSDDEDFFDVDENRNFEWKTASDKEKLRFLLKAMSVCFSVTGFALLLVSAISIGLSDKSLCGQISRAIEAGNELSSIASPIEINLCGLKHCTFDLSQCTNDCPLGYMSDWKGCPTSCFCTGEGIMQGDIHLEAQDVPYLSELFHDDENKTNKFDPLVLFDGMDYNSGLYSTWRTNMSTHSIPYMFDENISNETKRVVTKVLKSFSVQVCISFVERNLERDYIKFVVGQTCSSRLGKTKWVNTVTINEKSCIGEASIEHLLMHALGMHHQQTRMDRDDYINIEEENIMAGYNKQFSSMQADLYLDLQVQYNTESLMHFINNVYSKNGKPTIIGKNNLKIRGETAESLSEGLQESDVFALKSLYKCSGHNIDINTAQWSEWISYTSSRYTCRKYRICRLKEKQSLSLYCDSKPDVSWYQETEAFDCKSVNPIPRSGRKISGRARTSPTMFLDSSTSISRYICAGGELFKGKFNDDSQDDLLCHYNDGYAQIFLARSGGEYTSANWEGQTALCRNGGLPTSKVLVGDFNGDGFTDLFCHAKEFSTISLYTGSGFNGGVDWKGRFEECYGDNFRIFAIDLNGDNKDDIACGGTVNYQPYYYQFAFLNEFRLT